MSTETTPAQAPAEGESAFSQTLTSEQLAELQAAAAGVAEEKERYVRLYADFENFKKRAQREREETRRSAIESVVSRLLPALDNFEMAQQAAQQPGTTLDTLRTGVAMIHGQFRTALSELGIEEVDSIGQPFDPLLHDAVSQQETAEVPEGHIVQQLRKGYKTRDRLLRPASVVVARPPSSDPSTG